MSFYGLTRINNVAVNHFNGSLLRNEQLSHDLLITIKNHPAPILFHYVKIPTLAESDNLTLEMNRYCSPLTHTCWAPIESPYPNIWVLQFTPPSLVRVKQLSPYKPPNILISFPAFITMENRVELEERANSRHKCTLIPCSEFCLCPTTYEEPQVEDLHLHCMTINCVRFFEKTKVPQA